MILARSMLALNAQRASAQKFPNLMCRSITLRSVQPQTVAAAESHDQKNARLNRPLSPHLTIYQYQLTTVLSVSHRATGIILTAYAAGLAGVSLSSGDVKTAIAMIANLGIPAPILFVFKAGLAMPFSYHLCNGVRHLVWDMGKALTLKGVYSTGYTVVAISGILALIMAAL
nr:PREDICTED: succinate dehydrogenase cytochrome b560 subunit, mitochondrial-like [Bemisia tabaci]